MAIKSEAAAFGTHYTHFTAIEVRLYIHPLFHTWQNNLSPPTIIMESSPFLPQVPHGTADLDTLGITFSFLFTLRNSSANDASQSYNSRDQTLQYEHMQALLG